MTARQIRFAGAIAACGSLAGARRVEPFSSSRIWVLMRDERFLEHLLFIGVDRATIEACIRESDVLVRKKRGIDAHASGADAVKSAANTRRSGDSWAKSKAKRRKSGEDRTDLNDGACASGSSAEARESGADAANLSAQARESGANMAKSGANACESGADATDTDFIRRGEWSREADLGMEIRKSGADVPKNGMNIHESSGEVADLDEIERQSGAGVTDSGTDARGSGADAADSGTDANKSGDRVAKLNAVARDSGGKAADEGAAPGADAGRELLSEIRGLRAAAMRDKSLRLADRLGAASALERSLLETPPPDEERARFRLPADAIGRAFVDINRRIVPNVSYIFTGGRCSGKSSFIALKIIEIMLGEPTIHACAVRKLATTLRDSVYAQFEWAIRELGLTDKFRFKYSPLEIVYIPTGQTIFFRGVDDAAKLKSTRPPFGTIGILWREEADQLSGPDEARGIAQSVLRGGGVSYDFSSYNPPRSKKHWINTLPDGGAVRHHSTYLELPEEWVGRKFIDDAEHLREVDPAAYEHEYLGVPNGVGGAVFEKLEVRRITDEETAAFDRIYQGIDFGWYPDPFAFLRLHYDAARERIYLIDELYGTKLQNSEAADFIISRGYDDERIVCDSAEPRSIAELRRYGVPAVGAVKGAGSVAFGFRWLAARTIVVDPARTPKAYAELAAYELTPEGDYPDRDDHAISALRYATERIRA